MSLSCFTSTEYIYFKCTVYFITNVMWYNRLGQPVYQFSPLFNTYMHDYTWQTKHVKATSDRHPLFLVILTENHSSTFVFTAILQVPHRKICHKHNIKVVAQVWYKSSVRDLAIFRIILIILSQYFLQRSWPNLWSRALFPVYTMLRDFRDTPISQCSVGLICRQTVAQALRMRGSI